MFFNTLALIVRGLGSLVLASVVRRWWANDGVRRKVVLVASSASLRVPFTKVIASLLLLLIASLRAPHFLTRWWAPNLLIMAILPIQTPSCILLGARSRPSLHIFGSPSRALPRIHHSGIRISLHFTFWYNICCNNTLSISQRVLLISPRQPCHRTPHI